MNSTSEQAVRLREAGFDVLEADPFGALELLAHRSNIAAVLLGESLFSPDIAISALKELTNLSATQH